MGAKLILKVIVFGLVSSLSNIMTMWPIIILPQILETNFNQKSHED